MQDIAYGEEVKAGTKAKYDIIEEFATAGLEQRKYASDKVADTQNQIAVEVARSFLNKDKEKPKEKK